MRKMAVLVGLLIVALLLVACGDEPPPTQIVVVTATPLPTHPKQRLALHPPSAQNHPIPL